MAEHEQHLVVVSGLSGAGKSTALDALEDMGYHCIDNLPAALLKDFGKQMDSDQDRYSRVALGIDARAAGIDFSTIPIWLKELNERGIRAQMLFLDAADHILVKRFSETRRKHPLAEGEGALQAAIAKERALLAPMRENADWEIDTGQTNIHQLRHQAWKCVGPDSNEMTVVMQSFGFSKGVPQDVDYLFDVRCLPNPYWDAALRPMTGRDPEVGAWLGEQAMVGRMQQDIIRFLRSWLPELHDTHRSFVTVGIGCTGGRHRSVYLAEQVAAELRLEHPEIMLHHRDLEQ